jgi:hypothetical protein
MKEVAFVKSMIVIAGILQVALVIGSLAIPRLLNWKQELSKVSPLIKQMFWTYAGYILVTNLSFAIISSNPQALTDGSFLATSVTLFIGLYWGARIIIQFFYFDRTYAPKGLLYVLGEIALVILFIFFTIVYLSAFFINVFIPF